MKSLFKKIIVTLLQIEARAVLKKYNPKIVAITGSVGKTTTKDAIYTVLAPHFFVRKSDKSFNSEIGVPLTILGLPNVWSNPLLWLKNLLDGLLLIIFKHEYPEWLVLEIGADHPGDIERVTTWVHPDISVITRLSKVPVHVEFFASPEAVRAEKSFLAKAVKPTGTLVLNTDDEDVKAFAELTKAKVLTYGVREAVDVKATDYQIVYDQALPTGVSYRVGDVLFEIDGALGLQHVYTTLAACAVASALSLPLAESAGALRDHATPPGRMRILRGIHDSVIIDDTYNSSPVAAHEALQTLADIRIDHSQGGAGRKIAVLGDMLELGEFSSREHRLVGERAASVATLVVTVGIRSRLTAEEARAAGLPVDQVFSFDDSVAAGEFLKKEIHAGDVVLVKGSQGVRMEKTVAQILAEDISPETRAELLVRQDEEWQKR